MSNSSARSDKTRLISLTLGAAVLAGVTAMNAPAQPQQILQEQNDGGPVNDVNGYQIPHTPFNTSLFWWSGQGSCTIEFPSNARIGSMGAVTYPPKTPRYTLDNCESAPAYVVQDGTYYYYTDNNTGQLYRKALNAKTTDPSTAIPAMYAPLQSGWQFGAMMLYNGRLYWSLNLPGNLILVCSMNPDGTDQTREANLGEFYAGNHVKKLVGDSYTAGVDALFILTDAGDLYRQDIGSPDSLVTLDTGVLDFVIRDEIELSVFGGFVHYVPIQTLYAAKGVGSPGLSGLGSAPAGTLVSMATDTSGGGTGETLLYTASGQCQVTSVAADNQYLFVTEDNYSGDRNIWSQPSPSFEPTATLSGWGMILASVLGEVTGDHLQSDGTWLYFINANTINRYPTTSPAIGLDFAVVPGGLEVVQASQDLNQSVALVANKDTFVRGYAYVAQASGIPNTTFNIYARLNATVNGIAVPSIDSPVTSITTSSSLDTLRSSLAGTFLFHLPQSWVGPGILELTMTIDPDQCPPETLGNGQNPLANDSISLAPLVFSPKSNPTLVLVPMRTDFANYDPTSPSSGLGTILARASSLLPVNGFNCFHQDSEVQKPVFSVKACWCWPPIQINIGMDPFEFGGDKNWALFWMAARNYTSKNPPGNDIHWVGTVPEDASDSWNGIGGASGMNLSELVSWLPPIGIPSGLSFGNTTVVKFNPGPGTPGDPDWYVPHGGVTLAHELSHNYGRFHINQNLSGIPGGCGNSSILAPYQTPPFDPCNFGPQSGPTAIVGFDPISQEVIAPGDAADTMTYANYSWASGWNWNNVFNQVPNGNAAVEPRGQPKPMSDTPVLLLCGSIDTSSNTVTFQTFYLLDSSDVDSDKLAESLKADAAMTPGNPYQFLFLDAGGNPIQTNNVLIFPGQQEEGGPATNQLNFLQFTLFNTLTHSIQLTCNGAVLAERVASPNAPVIAITSLSLDSVNQLISLA
jgi:hypothetical protein